MATRKRTGVLAGAVAAALLAFPGIASAAVTSTVAGGTLTVTSDAADPVAITAAGGQVKVNGANPDSGAVSAAQITSIAVTGGPGANNIDLSGVTLAAYPAITSVTVDGRGGNDTITGSEHVDRLLGGDNDDDVSGIAGNDTLVWNPGDDTDRNEGGTGSDTIEVNGGGGPETFTVKPSATAGRVQFDRTTPAPFGLDIGTSERLDLNMAGGDDTVTADAGLAALGFALDIDGGAGNDSIDGGDGADLLSGGDGDDRIVPDDNPAGPGAPRDDARGDAGNDTIVWNGGDDDDINEGGAGIDTIEVNGAAANETFTVKPSATPGRIQFDRALPTPTPPGLFNIDIGTAERLDLNMNAGDDTLVADNGLPGFVLDIEGGDGNDSIDGGDAADLLSGGAGDDRIVPDDNPVGTRDVARGDAGDDTIVWNGGDDDDVNDGGDGDDTSEVNGAPTGERFTLKPSSVPGRVQFDRTSTNPAPFNLDIGTTERLLLNANAGNDTIVGAKGVAGLIAGEFNGGDGNDAIRGTDAEDRLNGEGGHDLIVSRDRAHDLVDCGPGIDLARVDRRDFLRGCNVVLGGHRLVQVGARKVAVQDGVAALPLKCAGSKRCKGVVRLRDNGKTLARAEFKLRNRSKTVRLELNRTGRRALADGSEAVTAQIDARDRRGNHWRATKRITLTR